MRRRVNSPVLHFVTLGIAGVVIGLFLGDADPAIQALTAAGVVLLSQMYFWGEPEI